MRSRTREILPILAAVAIVATISGCAVAPEPSPPTAEPSTTAPVASVFASNEEALAAATEAYAAYQQLATLVFSEGGVDAKRMQSVTSGLYEKDVIMAFEDAESAGLRSTGDTFFDNVMLQRVNETAPGGMGVVIVYLCSDVSQVNVLDASDNSHVDDDRIPRTALEVSFDWEPGLVGALTVGSRSVWKGGGVC